MTDKLFDDEPKPKRKRKRTDEQKANDAIAEAIKRGFGKGELIPAEWVRYQTAASDLRKGGITNAKEVEKRARRWKEKCEKNGWELAPNSVPPRWSTLSEPTVTERLANRRAAEEHEANERARYDFLMRDRQQLEQQQADDYRRTLPNSKFLELRQAVIAAEANDAFRALLETEPAAENEFLIRAIWRVHKASQPPPSRKE